VSFDSKEEDSSIRVERKGDGDAGSTLDVLSQDFDCVSKVLLHAEGSPPNTCHGCELTQWGGVGGCETKIGNLVCELVS